jgi:hypothetical protein
MYNYSKELLLISGYHFWLVRFPNIPGTYQSLY